MSNSIKQKAKSDQNNPFYSLAVPLKVEKNVQDKKP